MQGGLTVKLPETLVFLWGKKSQQNNKEEEGEENTEQGFYVSTYSLQREMDIIF